MKKRLFALVIAMVMVMSCFAGCAQGLTEEELAECIAISERSGIELKIRNYIGASDSK